MRVYVSDEFDPRKLAVCRYSLSFDAQISILVLSCAWAPQVSHVSIFSRRDPEPSCLCVYNFAFTSVDTSDS